MIKTIALGVGSLAAIGVFAYATRKWWLPLISGSDRGNGNILQLEPIDMLSYEYIIKAVDKAMKNEETKVGQEGNVKLMVMPNKIAQEYYDFTKTQGQPFFTEEEMTEDEKGKMVVVLVTTSDNLKDILWGKIFIPNKLAEDFYDFVPDDKLYVRPIDKDTDVEIQEISSETSATADVNLQSVMSYNVEKERTQKLSYEWILNEAQKVLQSDEFIKEGPQKYTLVIMPNKFANDCYDFCERNGKKLLSEDLTDEEKGKMVIVFLSSEEDKNVFWGKIILPDELTDDFSDFVPSDKIYKKQINVD